MDGHQDVQDAPPEVTRPKRGPMILLGVGMLLSFLIVALVVVTLLPRPESLPGGMASERAESSPDFLKRPAGREGLAEEELPEELRDALSAQKEPRYGAEPYGPTARGGEVGSGEWVPAFEGSGGPSEPLMEGNGIGTAQAAAAQQPPKRERTEAELGDERRRAGEERRAAEVEAGRVSPLRPAGAGRVGERSAAGGPAGGNLGNLPSPEDFGASFAKLLSGSVGGVEQKKAQEKPDPAGAGAGHILQARLLTAINSDTGGPVLAITTRDVFERGRRVLPAGTRAVGEVAGGVALGQRRVLVAWKRLVLPDGREIQLGAAVGAGLDGAAGIPGKVNYHSGLVFGRALGLSLVGAAGAVGRGPQNVNTVPWEQLARSGSAERLSEAAASLLDEAADVKPTVSVPAATAILIVIPEALEAS